MNKTFVGFGFGPIQSGLFLFEAYASKHFSRFVVAEIDDVLVKAIRDHRGRYTVNIARSDRIDQSTLEGIEIYNPRDPSDREHLIQAVAESDELATALPSVNIYDAGGESSVVGIISAGLTRRRQAKPTIVYAAENHNRAAEILHEQLDATAPAGTLETVQTLNTVIGKMSGVITDRGTIDRIGLTTVAPNVARAILVEEFNRILISRINLPAYRRGIDVFVEKEDLLPFEEAKLYGHNAIHALIGYLADLKGIATIAEAGKDQQIMQIAREAFIEESGATLIKRHAKLDDPLFTSDGFRDYADDLLKRMVNPNLNDQVSRVGRDHVRKLGYDDRLYGTMRLALQYDITPKNLALGAAAGVLSMIKRRDEQTTPLPQVNGVGEELTDSALRELLPAIWDRNLMDNHADTLITLTSEAMKKLKDLT